jgi:peptidase C39-like protein
MIILIAWAAALTGGLWLDVPFTKQEKEGCGSASIWMVMQYWKKLPEPVETIHRNLYSPQAGGIFASDMVNYFAAHGFKTFAFSGSWTDLEEHLAAGRPLIVSLGSSARGAPLHYVVVAGIEKSQVVLVNDPAQRKLWPMSRAEFERGWAAMNHWALLAVPDQNSVTLTDFAPEFGDVDRDEIGQRHRIPRIPERNRSTSPNSDLISASAAFRRADYDLARRLAQQTLKVDPENATANELVATTWFLRDNVDAALKYWNRVDQPVIDDVRLENDTRWNPIVLERSIPVSRATILRLSDYRLARKQLEASKAFSTFALDLKPSEGDAFELDVRAADRGNLSWLSWLRGLPYRTVSPELTNIDRKSTNISTLFRFDPNKWRAFGSVSGPMRNGVRYHIGLDVRDEDWDWNGNRFRLWRQEIDAGITSIASDRLTWSTSVIGSRRSSGFTVKSGGSVAYDLWVVPERRFDFSTAIRGEVGSVVSSGRRFVRMEPALNVHWLPQPRGTDYETRLSLRGGAIYGDAPFEELYSIGLDRDSDLRLRAHPATRDGRKGAALMAPRYVLLNSEVAKRIVDWSFVTLKLAPFADVAQSGKLYVDAGVDFRVSVASMLTISLSLGHDFKSGRNVLFTDVVK